MLQIPAGIVHHGENTHSCRRWVISRHSAILSGCPIYPRSGHRINQDAGQLRREADFGILTTPANSHLIDSDMRGLGDCGRRSISLRGFIGLGDDGIVRHQHLPQRRTASSCDVERQRLSICTSGGPTNTHVQTTVIADMAKHHTTSRNRSFFMGSAIALTRSASVNPG